MINQQRWGMGTRAGMRESSDGWQGAVKMVWKRDLLGGNQTAKDRVKSSYIKCGRLKKNM